MRMRCCLLSVTPHTSVTCTQIDILRSSHWMSHPPKHLCSSPPSFQSFHDIQYPQIFLLLNSSPKSNRHITPLRPRHSPRAEAATLTLLRDDGAFAFAAREAVVVGGVGGVGGVEPDVHWRKGVEGLGGDGGIGIGIGMGKGKGKGHTI